MAEPDRTYPMTIVHTEYGMCLTTTEYADWREVQDAFGGYKASLGPWDVSEVVEYLPIEYPGQQPFSAESVRSLAKSADGAMWAQELSDEERQAVPANVRTVAAAAGEVIDRLDDLYDQQPEALRQLLTTIHAHMPAIEESALGRLGAASRLRLLDLEPSQLSSDALNQQALAATDELRLLCASTWAEDSAHAAVEHEHLDELERLLDAGWDVDDLTSDGMTLLHHAIDIEIDAAAQTGSHLTVELTTLLVSRGADLGRRWQGKTPLEAATLRGHNLAVEVIQANGSPRERFGILRRKLVWIPLSVVAVLGAAAAIVWWAWLPQYRPGLKAGESYGVDVSNHQGEIDWQAVAGDNIGFAYIKATEGGDFVDDWFESNWDAARAAGLDVGAYHFFTLCRPGGEQADNFLGTVPVGEADLPAALDLELAGNCSDRPTTDWVHGEVAEWLERVEQATGDEVLLYVGPEFDERYEITGTFIDRTWHRRILRRPGGDRWLVWQLSFFSDVNGIDGGVDLNLMRQPG